MHIPCLATGTLCVLHKGWDGNRPGRVSALKCCFPKQHKVLSASAGKRWLCHGCVFNLQPPWAAQVSSLTGSERAGQGTHCECSSSLCSSQVCSSQQSQANYCLLELHPGLPRCVCVCPGRTSRQIPLPGKEGSFVCCKIPELVLGREEGTSWLWQRCTAQREGNNPLLASLFLRAFLPVPTF